MSSQPLGSHYLLDEQIGQGGMGVVWRGHDRTTGTVYAIKVVRPEYARDPMAVARFVRERTALVTLRHPNVVTVHDMIVEREQLALVMDMVSGGDLDGLRRARGGRLAPAEAASLAAQVGDGLAAAHAAGIVHRDLKPANVLLSTDRVLLADFGIAVLSEQARVTSTGGILGTPAYLPPELIAGQEPGPAGDVYALGITLYELLAGQPPFTGNTAAILYAHGTAAPPRIPGIPDALWDIIAVCLAKDPASRPPVTAVADALHAFAANPVGPVTEPALHASPATPVRPVTEPALHASPATPASPMTEQAFAGWSQGPQMRPDTVQVQVAPTAAQPPLATEPPRAVPSGHRRTMAIAAASVAAVVLVGVGVITLGPFKTSASPQQSAQLAGSGGSAQLAGSGGSAQLSGSPAAKKAGQGSSSATSRASGSSGATGQQASGPTPGNTPTNSSAVTSGSAGSSSTSGSSGATGSSGPSGSGSVPSSSSSTVTDADGFPILHASTGQEAHSCVILGSATDPTINATVQGVVCADVITSATAGGYTAKGELELVCETPAGADVQCADVIAQGELANAVDGVVETTGAYQCGHSYGACATGRDYVSTGTYSYTGVTTSNCSSNGVSITDVWGLALGSGTDTEIELPGSDKWVTLNSSNEDDNPNESTGHQYVCP